MRFTTRRHGAWLLALTAALSGCAPLTQLPSPPRGPGPLSDPDDRAPRPAAPIQAAPVPLNEPSPVIAPSMERYQPIDEEPRKRKGKPRDHDDDDTTTVDTEDAFDGFFGEREDDE